VPLALADFETYNDICGMTNKRARIQQQWSLFFCEWDVVLYLPASVPAFPHDHSLPIEARQLEIDGKGYPFHDACLVWADPAGTSGLPATAVPIDCSPTGLSIGVQIIGPYFEDRTTIAFAELLATLAARPASGLRNSRPPTLCSGTLVSS
jgi:amidase